MFSNIQKTRILSFLLCLSGVAASCSPRQANLADALESESKPVKEFTLNHKRFQDDLSILGSYTDLENLTLNFNAIKSLPPEIGKLTNLKKISLYGNALEDLPVEFQNLTSLETIVLGRNPMKSIPKNLGNLPKLRVLALDGTKITLSEEDIQVLASLPSLEILDLSEIEEIEKTPENIADLSHVKNILLKKSKLDVKERQIMFEKLPNSRLMK
ncbi:MAG: leucine-rich repeat domain-containing protein [Leptospira sp.]|nr:leucine-rich repeat domain-containing protein [Leptospira sp.]